MVLGAILLLAASSGLAHHALSAEFDPTQQVTLTGALVEVEWVNPHAWIHIDVMRPDGTVEHWAVETATPNTLLRRGLRKKDLVAGTSIKIDGYRAKDTSLRAHGLNLTLPDGRRIFLSSALADIGDDQR